jgi:hypothetical protein
MTSFEKKKAPDGTQIIRHDEVKPQLGLVPEAASFRKTREAVYERLFGKALRVSHELLPLVPHIDVYIFQRSSGERVTYSLVTGGMSDLEMTLPSASKGAPRRTELIFYCTEPREEYIAILRWLAHFPHSGRSFLGYGHTMPNGDPPAPFWGSTSLDTILFVPPIVKKDQALPSELSLAGQPVHFLWVVPLTTAECNYKLKNGFAAMMNLFQQNRHPHVFDPNRRSYV